MYNLRPFTHIDGFTTYWLSMRIKLVTFIEIALHCIAMTAIFSQNDHFFKPDRIDWKRLICSAFNQNGQVWKKWSFWVRIVVIAMQCNAISMKVTSLMRIDSQYVVNPSMWEMKRRFWFWLLAWLIKNSQTASTFCSFPWPYFT